MKLTARNDQVTIKSQSKSDFSSGKYRYWRKSASWEKSKVQALTHMTYKAMVSPTPLSAATEYD